MCGRFALYADIETIEYQFLVHNSIHFEPSYNISPSSQVVCLIAGEQQPSKLSLLQWGIVPKWAKSASQRIINARSETLFEKPIFKRLITSRRCCIVANGYYEWHSNADKTKQPYYISPRSNKPFAMAGIWSESKDGTPACIIITQPAQPSLSFIHHRMPLCISKDNIHDWLNTKNLSQNVIDDMTHREHVEFDYHPVSTMVNSPSNNSPECILLDPR